MTPTETQQNSTEASQTTSATVKKTKKANTLKVSEKTRTVKAKALKKPRKTVSAITVSKAKGTITYTKVSGSNKLTVTKSGKITVKKGTEKGTYKISYAKTQFANSYKKWNDFLKKKLGVNMKNLGFNS